MFPHIFTLFFFRSSRNDTFLSCKNLGFSLGLGQVSQVKSGQCAFVRSLEPGALEVVLSDFAPHEARFGNGSSEMQFGGRKGCKVVDQTGKFVCFFWFV